VRYRFKGIVRTTGQSVEGHAHGESPDEALQALSEHGIVTESLREDPEALNLNAQQTPFGSKIDSALDTAASQVPFEAIANKYKGKNVWVLDRDKIRRGVAQVVDQALREALANTAVTATGSIDAADVRKQVADAISGLFKDNRNITSQVSNTSMQLEHQIKRIESIVRRQESVLAQMTVAISRMGTGGGWGGGGGPRRFAAAGGERNEQNQVLLEIFKENLRLRGIEIDEAPATPPGEGETAPADQATASADQTSAPAADAQEQISKVERPAVPPGTMQDEIELDPLSSQHKQS
jgi:hypothetical protein